MELARSLLAHPLWAAALTYTVYILGLVVYRLFWSPLAKFPGPKLAAMTAWYEFYYDAICHGKYTFEIARMHQEYGNMLSTEEDGERGWRGRKPHEPDMLMLVPGYRTDCPDQSLGAPHRRRGLL